MDKKSLVSIIIGLFVIAGFLDIKYQGFFFRMLSCRMQRRLSEVFPHGECDCPCNRSEN